MKKIIMPIAFIVVVLMTVAACQKDEATLEPEPEPEKIVGIITDPDGQEYQWQVMDDGKKWLTENLNYAIQGYYSSWYNNDSTLGESYGRLYDWEAAKAVCAALGNDWRLPTNNDWDNLISAYGELHHEWTWVYFYGSVFSIDGYAALIEGGKSGFSALLGGWGDSSGNYGQKDAAGYYWSADRYVGFTDEPYKYWFSDSEIRRVLGSNRSYYSCRCVSKQ